MSFVHVKNTKLRGHQLLTEDIRRQLPKLYSTEGQGLKALAQVKFFTPDSGWYWYASEFDGQDTFYGLVVGHEIEIGYFPLSELEALTGPWGLPVERDLSFKPVSLEHIQHEHQTVRSR